MKIGDKNEVLSVEINLTCLILSAVTSAISITIFGFGLEQKPCMNRLPWNLMELIYPVFMVILLGCAAIGTNDLTSETKLVGHIMFLENFIIP